jgi:hypothetical protein
MLAMNSWKETMPLKWLDFKNFHRPHAVSLRGWSILKVGLGPPRQSVQDLKGSYYKLVRP